jgi:hypothetical protein
MTLFMLTQFSIQPNTLCLFSVSGLSYRRGNVEENDNAINIEVDIVLSDNAVTDDKAVFSFSFGAKLGSYICIVVQDIVVQRTGSEKPVLKVDASVNGTLSTRYFFSIFYL